MCSFRFEQLRGKGLRESGGGTGHNKWRFVYASRRELNLGQGRDGLASCEKKERLLRWTLPSRCVATAAQLLLLLLPLAFDHFAGKGAEVSNQQREDEAGPGAEGYLLIFISFAYRLDLKNRQVAPAALAHFLWFIRCCLPLMTATMVYGLWPMTCSFGCTLWVYVPETNSWCVRSHLGQ